MKLSIDRLIKLIPEWNGESIKINQINSGITNINFEVIIDEKSFFLSMPSSNSELCTHAPVHSCTISLYGNATPDLSDIASALLPFENLAIIYSGNKF